MQCGAGWARERSPPWIVHIALRVGLFTGLFCFENKIASARMTNDFMTNAYHLPCVAIIIY